jgi:hypothetical protein
MIPDIVGERWKPGVSDATMGTGAPAVHAGRPG